MTTPLYDRVLMFLCLATIVCLVAILQYRGF